MSTLGWRRLGQDLLPPLLLARLLVVLVCGLVLGFTAWRIELARQVQFQDSRTDTDNLARALADYARATMQEADILAAGLVERVENGGTSAAAIAQLHRMMVERVRAFPRVRSLFVYAPDGSWVAGSQPVTPIGISVSDREYFTYHRSNADRGAHIGNPIQSRSSPGRWVISVSRRIDRPDGSFGGVAIATIDFDTFSGFFSSFDIGSHGSIALLNVDSTLLVRIPAMPSLVGQKLPHSSLARESREGEAAGNARGISPIDGIARLNSFRRIEGYPLVVFVALSEDDILAEWKSGAWTALLASSAVALTLGVLGWRLTSQIRLRHQAEIAVRRSEGRYRLLADHSTDLVVHLGSDFKRLYVSPASETIVGYTPGELINGHPRETCHPDDWPRLSATLALAAEQENVPPVSYRGRRKNGTDVWLETIGHRLADRQGYVFAIRDITRRRATEMQLHDANNQLQRMVMLDGLTGIANRRCFDMMLAKEFRRAARAEIPLALLMLDVDHFKAFNDSYGHPAGDACLRAVAGAIGNQIKRPGDLAARYGGEEFAVLLPETDHAGAMDTAERLRQAIRGLGIEHVRNAEHVVTASIGVSVVWPQHNAETAQSLVKLADTALYRAKSMGRNRVCDEVSGVPAVATP